MVVDMRHQNDDGIRYPRVGGTWVNTHAVREAKRTGHWTMDNTQHKTRSCHHEKRQLNLLAPAT
eukprot:scaffold1994_cov98-Skeletonema_dohrnii-CCMP3373.AAC.1